MLKKNVLDNGEWGTHSYTWEEPLVGQRVFLGESGTLNVAMG